MSFQYSAVTHKIQAFWPIKWISAFHDKFRTNKQLKRLSDFIDGKSALIKKIFTFGLICAYFYAFAVGFRMPNLWSQNYYIPSFFDNFFRRGLAGSLLYIFGDLRANYYFIASIQLDIFIILNIVIIKAVLQKTKFIWIYTLFLIAPSGGFFFHTVGYIDQLLFLILFITMFFNNRIVNTILLFMSLFLHEIAMFTILPLYFAHRFFQGDNLRKLHPTIIICLFGIGLLYFVQKQTSENVDIFTNYIQERANYGMRRDFYALFGDSFSLTKLTKSFYLDKHFLFMKLLAPLYLISGYLFYKKGATLLMKLWLLCIGVFTPIIPLFVGFFAWDCDRWIFLSTVISLCTLYIAREKITLPVTACITCVFIVLIFFCDLTYFDRRNPRSFSGEDSLQNFFTSGIIKEIIHIPPS